MRPSEKRAKQSTGGCSIAVVLADLDKGVFAYQEMIQRSIAYSSRENDILCLQWPIAVEGKYKGAAFDLLLSAGEVWKNEVGAWQLWKRESIKATRYHRESVAG